MRTLLLLSLLVLLAGCSLFSTQGPHLLVFHEHGSTGGSTPDVISFKEGDSIHIPENNGNLFRTGYSFKGWNTRQDGTGTSYIQGKTIKAPGHDLILYAKWEPNTYTITFDTQGGSILNQRSITYNTEYKTLPIPTKQNKVFDGWRAEDGTSIHQSSLPPSHNHSLYAQWRDPRVTYTSQGHTEGTLPPTLEYPAGTEVTVEGKGSLEREGFEFVSWGTADPDIQTYLNEGDRFYVPGRDIRIDALWERQFYRVSFDTRKPDVPNPSPKLVFYGAFYGVLPVPEHHLHYIDNWYLEDTFQTPITPDTNLFHPGNHTLFASWKPLIYSISYILNGGSNHPGNPGTYTVESSTIHLSDPSRSGYSFSGWFDVPYTNQVSQIPSGSYGNKTFHARWDANTYSVFFDSQGGSSVTSVVRVFDRPYGTLAVPSKEGFLFGGWWDSDGRQVHSEIIVSIPNDHTLTARWIEQGEGFLVSYDSNNHTSGSVPPATFFPAGSSAVVLDDGSLKQGILGFRDWNTSADGAGITYRPGDTLTVSEDITLYAQYTHVFEVITGERRGQVFEIIVGD